MFCMFGTDEEGEIKVCFGCSYNCRVCTKDKNVGYVLERLIGAMTVQQKMDEIKEAISPMKEEEEEVAEPEFASTAVADVGIGLHMNNSWRKRKVHYKNEFIPCELHWRESNVRNWKWKKSKQKC